MRTPINIATITCLSLGSFSAHAQEKTERYKSPRFTVGLETGISTTLPIGNNYYYDNELGKPNSSVGLTSRYYFSRHFAFKAAIVFNTPEHYSSNGAFYKPGSAITNSFDMSYKRRGVEIPLMLEYHVLPEGSRIRPYFGGGLVLKNSNIERMYRNQDSSGTQFSHYNIQQRDLFLTFTQGVTWQLSKKIQLDESLQYMFNGSSSKLGLKIGVNFKLK